MMACPLSLVLDVVRERQARAMRVELYRHYMANIVHMFAGDGSKTLNDVLGEFDQAVRMTARDAAEEANEAYDNAERALRALEAARKG